MTPFLLFLRERLAQLTPLLRREVKMRIALHRHPGVAGVVEAAAEILQAVPGIELVDLQQPAVGLQSNNLRVLPAFKRELQRNELQAASDAGIDALVAVYHSDHRELCAHERDWPFRIINMLEVVGASMGLHRDDRYKELKLMQDADQIVAECKDLIAQHSLDVAARAQRHRQGDARRPAAAAEIAAERRPAARCQVVRNRSTPSLTSEVRRPSTSM